MAIETGTRYRQLIDVQEVRRAYALLVEPEQVIEVRALKASQQTDARWKGTLGGYFNDIAHLLSSLATIKSAMGVYITLQPCHKDLLHRANNKIQSQEKDFSTPDKYVTRYKWLLIDSDPERVSGISSDEAEHNAALAQSILIAERLRALGWPDPIRADSGNGAHLLYALDLPVSETDLIKRVLESIASSYSTPTIKVDRTVYNPSRICKLYGTLACKGDDTPERPHRMSRILEIPEEIQTVSRDLLEAIATPVTQVTSIPPTTGSTPSPSTHQWDMEDFITKHTIDTYAREDYQGGSKWVMKQCPFCGSTERKAILTQAASGAKGFKCVRECCASYHWQELRKHYEPDAYTPHVTAPVTQPLKTKAKPEEQSEQKEERESVAHQLVRMAQPLMEVFTDSTGARYAKVLIDGHYEVMLLGDKGAFRRWLHCLYEDQTNGLIPNSTALADAISTFEARAQFKSKKKEEVYLRIAYVESTNTLYLDMANDAHQVIEISETGWEILDKSPVCFRRVPSMAPLPTPLRGGSVDEMRPFVNCQDSQWILVKAWILGCLQPSALGYGEYPVLNLSGGQGTAKTSAALRVRSVIDPSFAPLRKKPKDDQSFAIMAHNNFVVALDNLSYISSELSDAMCTLSTGSGDAYRKHYTNDEEAIFVAKRPQIFTGIEQLATRGDLLDRCILVNLLEISDEHRLESSDLNIRFQAAHPSILGAFLSCAVEGLKNRKSVKMEKKPRLADFAKFVVASESKLQCATGDFMAAYNTNREEGVASELEASPVAAGLIKMMSDIMGGVYTATATELLKKLTEVTDNPQITRNERAWPQTPRGLSAQLKRLARSLRSAHIFVSFERNGSERTVKITTSEQASSNDAKLDFCDAKHENSDAKLAVMTQSDDGVTQKNTVCVTPSDKDTCDFTPSVTQSDAKYPNFLFVSDEKKEEREGRETPHVETAGNLRHFASHDEIAPPKRVTMCCLSGWTWNGTTYECATCGNGIRKA